MYDLKVHSKYFQFNSMVQVEIYYKKKDKREVTREMHTRKRDNQREIKMTTFANAYLFLAGHFSLVVLY